MLMFVLVFVEVGTRRGEERGFMFAGSGARVSWGLD